MTIELHPNYKKSYKTRIAINPKLVIKVNNRIEIFRLNPENPVLRVHHLAGTKRDLYSFSVSGDIRIIYLPVSRDRIVFLDIGTHNQVY